MRFVSIKRLIPEGGINPNTNKPYKNMEEKLSSYFNSFDKAKVKIPVYIRNENTIYKNPTNIDDNNIAGYAISFTNEDMTIFIKDGILKKYKNPRIEVVTNVLPDHETITRINKLLICEAK